MEQVGLCMETLMTEAKMDPSHLISACDFLFVRG